MDERKKVIWTGIIFLVVLGLGVGLYYFFVLNKFKEPTSANTSALKKATQLPQEEQIIKEEKAVSELPSVELDKSDDLVRRLVLDLTPHPQFAAWLKNSDLVRKFVAVVDNIANRLSPRPQLEFLEPAKEFKFIKKEGRLYLDPSSYYRYDQVVDVFSSLNTERCVKLYREFKPLIQEAYRDLGYPNQDFDQTLLKAIVELLKTPVVSGDILLEKKVVTYMMGDKELEDLSLPQKHLLRMGPENIEIAQAKLREFALALGFAEPWLPKPWVYTPEQR
jgi:hypothetical protein